MKLSVFLNYLEKLKQTEVSEYSQNAHKPYGAYVKYISNSTDIPIENIYKDIKGVYQVFKEKYAPNTTRNYLRYLQASLNLNELKTVIDKDIIIHAKKDLQDYIKACDRDANTNKKEVTNIKVIKEDHIKDKKTEEEDSEEESEEDDSEEESEDDYSDEGTKEGWDINNIILDENPDISKTNDHDKLLMEAQIEARIYKAQLECMWRMLELIYKK